MNENDKKSAIQNVVIDWLDWTKGNLNFIDWHCSSHSLLRAIQGSKEYSDMRSVKDKSVNSCLCVGEFLDSTKGSSCQLYRYCA